VGMGGRKRSEGILRWVSGKGAEVTYGRLAA